MKDLRSVANRCGAVAPFQARDRPARGRSRGPLRCPSRSTRSRSCPFAWAALDKIAGDLLESSPFDAGMTVDMGEDALVHHQNVRLARDIGVDGHGEGGVVVLAVYPVELVQPHEL